MTSEDYPYLTELTVPDRLRIAAYEAVEHGIPAIHLRAVLDAAEAPSALRSKPLRHTYITARLQTLDRGQPVSLWAVVREVGHASTQMIERIYGHLGEVRHRSDVVEFRVEQHEDLLADSLALMGQKNTV